MLWLILLAFVVGLAIGFIVACRGFVLMQEDFVATFNKPPKGE